MNTKYIQTPGNILMAANEPADEGCDRGDQVQVPLQIVTLSTSIASKQCGDVAVSALCKVQGRLHSGVADALVQLSTRYVIASEVI